MARPRLVVATTAPISLDKLLRGQLEFLNRTFDVTAIAADGPELETVAAREGVKVKPVPMVRQPSPLADLRSLVHLIRTFRRIRPDIVHAYTPKAGLLAMLAARICRVPIRVRTVTGLPLMTKTGVQRRILAGVEWISFWAATHVLSDSHGIQSFVANDLGFTSVSVLAHGSVNGVDTSHYSLSDSDRRRMRQTLRSRRGIPDLSFVILFIGRVVYEKGIGELVRAFETLQRENLEVFLLLVGPREDGDPIDPETSEKIHRDESIFEVGYVDDVRPYLAAADVFVLPSYREGLPNVLLQAAVAEVPIVASDIPGNSDVITNGTTGLLIPARDTAALYRALHKMSLHPELRRALASNARRVVAARFDQGVVLESLRSFYLAGAQNEIDQ